MDGRGGIEGGREQTEVKDRSKRERERERESLPVTVVISGTIPVVLH